MRGGDEMRASRGLFLLVLTAAGLALLFHVLRLPGAWLFGPLAASALFAVRGWHAVQFSQGGLHRAGNA